MPRTAFSTSMGGGVLVYGAYSNCNRNSDRFKAYFVDCVFSNNVAKWGAAMRGGTAIRCLLADNAGLSFGQTVCAGALWNCVVRGTEALQSDRMTVGNGTMAVNTSFYDNDGFGSARTNEFYNCAFNMQSRSVNTASWGTSGFFNTYKDAYETATDRYVFLSPASGDFRPVAGKALEGLGRTVHVTNAIVLPPGTVLKDFNGNAFDLDSETCDAGAVQGAVTPDGGCMLFDTGDISVDGVYNRSATYSHVEHWPTQRRVVSHVEGFMRWRSTINGSYFIMHYPQMDGSCWLTPLPSAGEVLKFNRAMASLTLWTDPDADASVADGTSGKPFRTLQAAMDHVAETGVSPVIIRAMPGEYDEGEAFAYGHTNRVVFPMNQAVLLKSVAGAESTVIRGRMDPGGPYPEHYRGCGLAAMRCVAAPEADDGNSVNHAIQGFTFADGCSSATNNSYKGTPDSDSGGGLRAMFNLQVHDCVFTNCNAVRCGASSGSIQVFRSRFDDCVSYGGVIRDSTLISCEVLPTCSVGTAPSDASKNSVCGTGTRGLFSTLPVSVHAPYGSNSALYHGCLLAAVNLYKGSYWASVLPDVLWAGGDAVGYTEADAMYIDADNYDFRLPFVSPALTAGVLPERGTDSWTTFGKTLAQYSSGDIDGNPLVVRDGVPMPGARQVFVGGFNTVDGSGALKLSGTVHESGYTPDEGDADVTVTANEAVARQAIGFTVNGVTNLFADAGAGGCVIPREAVAAGVHLEPVFSDRWYVDAEKGDDGNPGYDPEAPKRTLASVLAAATEPGDVVYAAPGTYDEGLMYSVGVADADLASRAVLRSGVTLVSQAGVGSAVIAGASASAGNADGFGRGSDAVRCVFLHAGAKLKGFTLRDGRTDRVPEGESFGSIHSERSDYYGGGVAGESFGDAEKVGSSLVEDCVISNCCAVVGGVGKGVTFVGCRMLKCRALRGSAVERCGVVNVIVDDMDSEGASGICVNDTFACVNVTIGDAIRKDSSGYANAYYRQWSRDYGMTNCVILGAAYNIGSAVNSCFVHHSVDETVMTGCRRISVAEAALDENYRPDRQTSVLVDAGVPAEGWSGTDAYGGQRVYNGAVDIGAVEADWRERYAECLGSGSLTVVSAGPGVTETDDGQVAIADGTLVVDWRNRSGSRETKFTGNVEVSGAGSLTVAATGGATLSYDAGDGLSPFAFSTSEETLTLTFEHVPSADGEGSAVLSGFRRVSGMVFLVR